MALTQILSWFLTLVGGLLEPACARSEELIPKFSGMLQASCSMEAILNNILYMFTIKPKKIKAINSQNFSVLNYFTTFYSHLFSGGYLCVLYSIQWCDITRLCPNIDSVTCW